MAKTLTPKQENILDILFRYPDLYGRDLGFKRLKPFHRDWIAEDVSRITHGIPFTRHAHRGSFKTTCLMIAVAIVMITHPHMTLGLFRKTDKLIKKFTKGLRAILVHKKTQYYVQELWGVPLRITVDNYAEINTNISQTVGGDPQFEAAGIKGSVTGSHKDYYITDDIVAREDRRQQVEREKTIDFFKELVNLANPVEGQDEPPIGNAGTIWHKDDLFGISKTMTAKPDKIVTVKESGIFSDEQLAKIREKIGSTLYALNYEMELASDENKRWKDPRILTAAQSKDEMLFNGIGHIDARYSGKHYTAFTILKVNKEDQRIYAFGVTWYRHVDDCMEDIKELVMRFKIGTVWCERNADKGYLTKELSSKGIRAKDYHEDMNKNVKIEFFLQKYWKRIYFLQATKEWEDKLDEEADRNATKYSSYLDQVTDYEESMEPDDAPDSLVSCLRYYGNRPMKASEIMSDSQLKIT